MEHPKQPESSRSGATERPPLHLNLFYCPD